MHSGYGKLSGFISLFIVQIIFLVLYWVYVRYDVEALPKDDVLEQQPEGNGLKEEHVSKYPREYYHWNSFDGRKAFKNFPSSSLLHTACATDRNIYVLCDIGDLHSSVTFLRLVQC